MLTKGSALNLRAEPLDEGEERDGPRVTSSGEGEAAVLVEGGETIATLRTKASGDAVTNSSKHTNILDGGGGG